MAITVIGIDFATKYNKVGLAFGSHHDETLNLEKVDTKKNEEGCLGEITNWIDSKGSPTLIAIDAPLGWPKALPGALCGHWAGEEMICEADRMFSRTTDKVIHDDINKQKGNPPFEVGADRIARTAHASLCFLAKLRKQTVKAIPLAWEHENLTGISVIEVYPAATLRSHDIKHRGYKKNKEIARTNRMEIFSKLSKKGLIQSALKDEIVCKTDHKLDAVICMVAAKDFLDGECIECFDRETARKEGWIWVKRPDETKTSKY